tara:strand:- start:24 stop:470 length:447 start_codon:yes stop_codon:yes gene_type:complete
MENLERAQKETEEFSEEMRQRVEKAKNMDISDLKGAVLQRFQELTDEEVSILESLQEHPVGAVIIKLIGPELDEIFSEPKSETEQMLADDMPREMYERAPIEDTRDTMYSAGPNPEQYRENSPKSSFPRPEDMDKLRSDPMLREMASR